MQIEFYCKYKKKKNLRHKTRLQNYENWNKNCTFMSLHTEKVDYRTIYLI